MDEVSRAERELDSIEPGYLARVRAEAARLGVRGQGPDLVRDAVRDVGDLVQIDVDPPTYASQPGGQAVKNAIKRSVQWYIRYVATQIGALGEALVTFGTAVADRLDELEGSDRQLQTRVHELTERVEALESPKRRTT